MTVDALHQGCCLDLLPKIESGSVDLILADLPYGTTQNRWDSVIPLDLLWVQYRRIAKPDAAIVLTAQTPFDKILGCSNLEWLRYEWIWEKTSATGHLNANRAPMKAHENVLVFYADLPVYHPQKTQNHARKVSTKQHGRDSKRSSNYGDYGPHEYDSTERFPRSVIRFPKDVQKSKLSPTQKPLALMEYLIRTYSDSGDLVLDNAMGSGTTCLAARNLGRHFIGMEKDPEEFLKASRRLEWDDGSDCI